MQAFKAVLVGLGIIALVALICVGGYQLGWWLNKDGTNRQSEIYNDSFQRQNALVAEAGRVIADVKTIDVQIVTVNDPEVKATLGAQRKALVTQACETIGKFSGTVSVPASTTQFQTKEC